MDKKVKPRCGNAFDIPGYSVALAMPARQFAGKKKPGGEGRAGSFKGRSLNE